MLFLSFSLLSFFHRSILLVFQYFLFSILFPPKGTTTQSAQKDTDEEGRHTVMMGDRHKVDAETEHAQNKCLARRNTRGHIFGGGRLELRIKKTLEHRSWLRGAEMLLQQHLAVHDGIGNKKTKKN